MRKFLSYFFAVILSGVSLYFLYASTLGPCDKPLKYAIGRFDGQFGVSREEFKSRILEAETVWEKALNENFFLYDEEADFKVNLIYDQRQQTTAQKQKTEFGLAAAEDIFKNLDAKFNDMKTVYDQRAALHEKAVASLENKQKDYESKVNYWNSKGGAPKGQYETLQKELEILNAETYRLNAEAISLNALAKELNILLERRNKAAVEYNKIAGNYNKKYGHGLEFDQAEYTGMAINVYQFGDKKDLALALTHEFGHVLGMDHVENPMSIMYYLTGDNVQTSVIPSAEDLAELEKVCNVK